MSNEKSLIEHEQYCCKICDYNTMTIKDYNKHLLTRKHKHKILRTTSKN